MLHRTYCPAPLSCLYVTAQYLRSHEQRSIKNCLRQWDFCLPAHVFLRSAQQVRRPIEQLLSYHKFKGLSSALAGLGIPCFLHNFYGRIVLFLSEEPVHALCRGPVHARNLGKLFLAGGLHRLNGFKVLHQRLSPGVSDARNVIQHRAHLALAAQAPVVLDGKPVSLILNSGDEPEAFGMPVNGNLHILVIQSPGPVVVILHHAADWNGKPQF